MDVWETILSFWRKVTLFSGDFLLLSFQGAYISGCGRPPKFTQEGVEVPGGKGIRPNSRAKSLGAEAKSWRPNNTTRFTPNFGSFLGKEILSHGKPRWVKF